MSEAIQKAREALTLKYATALKTNGDKIAGTPITVLVQLFREYADELSALAALDAETEVKVRGLEWSDEPKDGGDPTGRREGDAFVVWTTDGSLYRLKERRATDRTSYSCTIWRADTPISSHGDFREAKSAAQADYERRIRSALVTPEARS